MERVGGDSSRSHRGRHRRSPHVSDPAVVRRQLKILTDLVVTFTVAAWFGLTALALILLILDHYHVLRLPW